MYPGGEREIHRRQLRLGICSKRLYGSLGNRARIRESEGGRELRRELEPKRERERVFINLIVGT